MYSPNISEADIQIARYLKKYGSSSSIRLRMLVLFHRGMGMRPGSCARAADVHRNSVTRWIKIYISAGIEGLLEHRAYRPQSELLEYADLIAADFEQHPPRNINEACYRIEQLTGLKRGPTQVRHFIKRVLKYRYRKYRPLPGGKKTVDELNALQQEFIQNKLQPLLDKALHGVADVFFVDATHPAMGFHNGHVWSEQPQFVRTSSGRYRMNILGAMQAVTNDLYSITTPDYIKATTVVELIAFLREQRPGKRIHLVLDNARYQRCELVQKAARKYRIHLLYLPPYSPNLNLIERFWKMLKEKVLAGVFYPDKESFSNAIFQFIEQVNLGQLDEQIQPIMKLNFQTLKAA